MSILITGIDMPTKGNPITVLFPPSLFDELDALAIKTGVSKSEMIREATAEYVKRHTAEEAT